MNPNIPGPARTDTSNTHSVRHGEEFVTEGSTQESLDELIISEKKETGRPPPQWAKSLWSVAKKVGLVIGVGICAAATLGTFVPFGIAAIICKGFEHKKIAESKKPTNWLRQEGESLKNQAQNLKIASFILGAPIMGFFKCLEELGAFKNKSDTGPDYKAPYIPLPKDEEL